MELAEKSVMPGNSAHARVAALYEEAFPPEERVDLDVLDGLANAPDVDFTAYYDDDTFCGFSFSIDADPYLYLVFLAVDGSSRSRGYGSRILSSLKARYPDRVIALEIEQLDSQAANATQRERRFGFYQRSGIKPAGYDSLEGEMVYMLLATGDIDAEEFVHNVNRITQGAIPLELIPSSK